LFFWHARILCETTRTQRFINSFRHCCTCLACSLCKQPLCTAFVLCFFQIILEPTLKLKQCFPDIASCVCMLTEAAKLLIAYICWHTCNTIFSRLLLFFVHSTKNKACYSEIKLPISPTKFEQVLRKTKFAKLLAMNLSWTYKFSK
jgi:hypothetical protein